MSFRKFMQILSIFALLLGFLHTPAQAAIGNIHFGISVDVKQFSTTGMGIVRVFADSSDPVTDPIVGIDCYNGFQIASNQCQYNIHGNEIIRASVFSQRSGVQAFQYAMCEVDNTAPMFAASAAAIDQSGSNNNAWANKAASLFSWAALTDRPSICADGSLNGYASGIQGYKVYFGTNANGGPSDPSDVTVSTPFYDPNKALANGVYYLRVQPFDHWNNYGLWQTLYTFKLDTAQPTIAIGPQILPDGQNGWYIKTVPGLTIQTIDLYNNIASIQTRVNSGPWMASGSGQLDLSGDGIYNIDALVTDQAGNLAMSSAQLKIDRTPISYSMVKPAIKFPVFKFPTWYTSDVSLLDKNTLTSQVTDVSGVSQILFKQQGGTWSGVAPIFTTNGTYSVDVQTADVAGNMDSGTVTIQLDKDKPVMKATLDTQNTVSAKVVRLLVTAFDLTSGIGSVSYQMDDLGVHDITTINTNGDFIQDIDLSRLPAGKQHTITVQTTDVAGNNVTQAFEVSTDAFPIYLPVVLR